MKPILLILVLSFLALPVLKADDTTQADALFNKLLAAVMAKDYDAFVADGTVEVKAGIAKSQSDAVASMMDPKLEAGYDVTSLGELNKSGYEVYLYRIRFKNGADDVEGTLSLKDGKVAG